MIMDSVEIALVFSGLEEGIPSLVDICVGIPRVITADGRLMVASIEYAGIIVEVISGKPEDSLHSQRVLDIHVILVTLKLGLEVVCCAIMLEPSAV